MDTVLKSRTLTAPVTVIRGLAIAPMKGKWLMAPNVTFTIDWLNFTAVSLDSRNVFQLAARLNEPNWNDAKPVHGYNLALENRAGARVMWHTSRIDMGTHIMYPGKTLNNYNREGVTARAIIRWHSTWGDICKRIDLALDAHDLNLNIPDLYRMIEGKQATTKAKSYNLITGSTGDTLYVGSRQSEQFMRIYDKAAERKLDHDWKRIELELKGSRAIQFARHAALVSDEQLATRSRQMIKSIIDFPTDTWRDIVGVLAVGMAKAQENEPDTKAWLLTQVAPAMGKFIARTGDKNLLEQFLSIIALYTQLPPE